MLKEPQLTQKVILRRSFLPTTHYRTRDIQVVIFTIIFII